MDAEQVRYYATDLGFTDVGLIPAQPSPQLDAYMRWLQAGMYGSMSYLVRPDRQARRRDLNIILPDVKSMVIVALDYAPHPLYERHLHDPRRGRISNYAWGRDYHDIMTPRLEELADWMREESGSDDVMTRVYVDTGAILERNHAQLAGLGFTGKNTMLISPRRGSYLFLGEILTTQEFDDYDVSERATICGTCTRCLEACPTDAFPEPYVLDARRCISYLTIEHKGSIPIELRRLIGNWIYGCDICQIVCPFTRKFSQPTTERAFWPPYVERVAPKLNDLLWIDDAQFKARFRNSPLWRIQRERLVRNACVAAGNSDHREFITPLDHLARHDPSELIREHAAWALDQLMY